MTKIPGCGRCGKLITDCPCPPEAMTDEHPAVAAYYKWKEGRDLSSAWERVDCFVAGAEWQKQRDAGDAARYRWLRSKAHEMPARGGHGDDGPPYMRLLFTWAGWPHYKTLDAAIDSAMKGSQ